MKRSLSAVWLPCLVFLILSLISLDASAQARAWLDRDRIGFGETVTLNVEVISSSAAAPDYSPLRGDFRITGNTSRRELTIVNGQRVDRTLYAVALQPQREGVLTVPSLDAGGMRTQPLSLVVSPGNTRSPARSGDDVFIESEADDQDPYVQQAVGWVVRLYSAVPLVSGQIDQPAPEGASLQRVGDDAQYSRQIDGRRYTIVERRYQLIPERSGALTIPGASFDGRGAAGFFDDFFGGRGSELQAQAPPRFLQVRPAPANAPQPWLPLHDLQLRYQSTPQDLTTGAAATLTIEATADGATAAQMPELQLPAIDGVQVFAEPVQADESFDNGRPRVKLTRRYSLVPGAAGEVNLRGLRLSWWDVRAGTARTATLPPLSWQVAVGDGGAGLVPPPIAGSDTGTLPNDAASPADTGEASVPRMWAVAALAFAALWLVTLVWAFQHRGNASRGRVAVDTAAPESGTARHSATELKRALHTGDFGEVIDTLQGMARPPAASVDELMRRLAPAEQRAAIEAMQRARWADGDGTLARNQARQAFAKGPRWIATAAAPDSPLPPLYPGPGTPAPR